MNNLPLFFVNSWPPAILIRRYAPLSAGNGAGAYGVRNNVAFKYCFAVACR